MQKKKIIFYQSIAVISEIVEILKQNLFGTFTIVVTGGEPLTNLLKKLQLKKKFGIKVYNFHALSLKNPVNILNMYYKFNYSNESKKILSHFYDEVLFFSSAYDFVTPIFLSKLSTDRVTFINFYRRKFAEGKPGIKDIIQILIIKLILNGAKIKLMFDKNYKQIYYQPVKIKIKEKPINNKIPKSIFKLPLPKNKKYKKVAIFFDAYEEVLVGNHFKKIIFDIFNLLEKDGFLIVIKKHPVSDLSNCIKNLKKCFYILDPLPVELYHLQNVKVVFGLFSLSLSKITEKYPDIKVFSFLKLLNNINNSKHLKSYLNKMKRSGDIYFPCNLSQLKKIVDS